MGCPAFQIRACLLGFLAYSCLWQDTEAAKCPADWTYIGKSCYGYVVRPLTWYNAEKDCHSHGEGAHLASLHSDYEMRLVASHLAQKHRSKGRVWIGLYLPKNRRARKWTWTDGSAPIYLPWNKVEPDKSRSWEICVELQKNNMMRINGIACTKKNPYLCEIMKPD